jgi:hypothetical protein
MTRLLLSVNILHSKMTKITSSSVAWTRARQLRAEVESSHRTQLKLREKLNAVNKKMVDLNKARDEQSRSFSEAKL